MKTKNRTKSEKMLAALKKCKKSGLTSKQICALIDTNWPYETIRNLRKNGNEIECFKRKDGTFAYKLIG